MRIGIAVDHDGRELTVQMISALRPPVMRCPHSVPYERYERQGRQYGGAVQGWAQAEQQALLHRARCNRSARLGEYNVAKDVHSATAPK